VYQTLTKLRFTRNELTKEDKDALKVISRPPIFPSTEMVNSDLLSYLLLPVLLLQKLLQEDGFYTIRLPSNVLDAKRKDHVVSSIRAVS
jgi:ER membrane protein complex subunit 10